MAVYTGFNEATALECKGQSLLADLEECEKNGFDYIEIRFDSVRDYLKDHTLDDLAQWFAAHNLKPWAYNTLIFFNQRNEAGVKEIDDEVDFIIEVSEAIGMKTLVTVPSFDVVKEDGNPYSIEEFRDEAVTRLQYLADKVAPHGLRISLEFCGAPGCSINQFGTAYEVVKAVSRDNVGITLDCFHFHGMDSHWEDLENADAKKIFILHLNDVENLPIGQLADIHRVWPGEGVLELERTFKILKDKGFEGVCTIEEFRPEYYELSHAENVKTAYEYTKAIVDKYFG
ncbi:MAG: sugar phosphate isomerase/epimerase [Clostridiales Family XIII bacterium]|nr:sugar phosphate isomerase/epimerase [Clostridiales Family XIII bacterium]